MESSKVRTALEEMDDKGDGAFKVRRLAAIPYVAAPVPMSLHTTPSSAQSCISSIDHGLVAAAEGVAVQEYH